MAAVRLSKEARAGLDLATTHAIEKVMTAIRDTCHARYALIARSRKVTPDDAPELVRVGLAAWEVTTLQLAWDSKQPGITRAVLVGMYEDRRAEIVAHIEAMARTMTGGDPLPA